MQHRIGLGILAVIALLLALGIASLSGGRQPVETPLETYDGGFRFEPTPLAFKRVDVGPPFKHRPRICNVQIVDFDGDGRRDILAADAQLQQALLYRNDGNGGYEEVVLGSDLLIPAHLTVVDLDQDGRNDVLVSILGDLNFDNSVIGQLVLLHQQEDGSFTRHLLLDDVRRVADAQAGDFDGDGDLDLAVAVFGYDLGQVLWLENKGDFTFLDHELHWAPGTIHVPVADFDGDGDLDIAAIVSQDEEEIWAFDNQGDGTFKPRRLHHTVNYDIGSAGLVKADLDQDGDMDLIWPVGDNFEDAYSYPQPYHGCFWLENQGNWQFKARRIATFGGCYAADVGDMDGDGDLDVALVSMINDWANESNASLVWLENDGKQSFTTWQIASDPIQFPTVACGDLNDDGRADIVAGGVHFFPPFNRLGRITSWISMKEADQ